ncbi:MAG: hypothetical protein EPO21_14640 [Chloroflexota bacterium]|nr:MAG: hypothetical protein EPO21_14640 [Chloroflexota bacterium]
MSHSEELLYSFPPPSDPMAIEWDGGQVGASNVITRTKSRTLVNDKTIDRVPGLRGELLDDAIEHILTRVGKEPVLFHDVVIHGVRVRAYTNSAHLIDFWRDNWYSIEEWERITGLSAPPRHRVTVFALTGVERQQEAAYYSRSTNTIVFFNTAYYGQLKSWVLGAVGRVLAEEFGIHSVHGASLQKGKHGILYIAPTGTGKSTSSYGLMSYPDTRFHSDDWVYLRYVYAARNGELVAPAVIERDGHVLARGFQCHGWLEEPQDLGAMVRGLTLEGGEISLPVTGLDISRPRQAYAYTSEKVFYLRTNLVENFPESLFEMAHSKLENVPQVHPRLLEKSAETLREIVAAAHAMEEPPARAFFSAMSDEEIATLAARMFAFDNSRAMLDIERILPPDRVFVNPMEPLRVSDVFLLKRNFADPVVLERLSLSKFIERLLIGMTPDGKREIAYNAYRAVDDAAERGFVNGLESQSANTGKSLYDLFERSRDMPDTLYEEFELFRVLYGSTTCFDLNTVIQRDPTVRDKKEAVARTMSIIVAAAEGRAQLDCYDLENYGQLRRIPG